MNANRTGVFWIASYPKSGNTWVRLLITSLLSGGGTPDLSRPNRLCPSGASHHWMEDMLGLPTSDLTVAEQVGFRRAASAIWARMPSPPRCLKIHDHHDPRLFPPEITAGVVYIVRDPRDVAPSLADHNGVTLDAAIQQMAEPRCASYGDKGRFGQQARQILGSWSAHVTSWLAAPAAPLLLLRYEALLADPVGETSRLAAFLGLTVTPDRITRTVAACRFDTLRRAETATGFSERSTHQKHFFRQGRAGAWRATLSAEQAARIAADHGMVMARLGYE